jgi:hypothetical protein
MAILVAWMQHRHPSEQTYGTENQEKDCVCKKLAIQQQQKTQRDNK